MAVLETVKSSFSRSWLCLHENISSYSRWIWCENRLLLANTKNLAERKCLVKIWKNSYGRSLQVRTTKLWCVRDLHSLSCPTSLPKQSCWQHELMPALALSTSLWRPPEYSFYHLSGQPLPVLHYLPQGKRSEASRNLPSCSFYFDPCSLCCWEEFGSTIDVPRAGSRSFCTHSSDPLDLFSRAVLWSQFVLIYGVILAQVCVIFYFLWVPFCW